MSEQRLLNLTFATASKPHLFRLPPELRTQVYLLCLKENKTITVERSTGTGVREPGLLAVCSSVRQEARPLYYLENRFFLSMDDLDVMKVLPWLEMVRPFFGDDLERGSRMTFGIPDDTVKWQNLEKWLELAHAGRAYGPRVKAQTSPDWHIVAIAGTFDVARASKEQPWELAKLALPGLRKMLASHDEKWLD